MNNLLGRSKLFIKRNGSTILTVAGGLGAITTTVMAVKATPKALKTIEAVEEVKGEKLTKTEIIKVAGPAYIPTVLMGMGTLACIFGANALNKRQQASLVSAYGLMSSSYKEYKKKVVDLYGKEVDDKIRTEMAKEHFEKEKVADGKQLFYDDFSERYFESTLEDVLRAEANLNKQIAVATGAYLNEFYEFLGIDKIPAGNELGWCNGLLESMYWTNWVDFDHTEFETVDGVKCTLIKMMQEPVIDFAYY